jgi:hypothetical protein
MLSACGSGSKKELRKIKVDLKTDGPLYSGSNTATGTWSPALEENTEVSAARFTSVRFRCEDTILAGNVDNMVLQLAAPNAEMRKVAFFKGKASGNEVSLQLADDQDDIRDFFRGQEVTFVVDYDFIPEELNDNLNFSIEFDAELQTK